MKIINVLDNDTINKIAAGEVVERPSSVVKELVENAIDAKSSAVTVEIKEGGISFIRVTDNGGGINKDDIDTAFVRHATSKIKSAMDLMTIGSLGFRGEALSSIASVSQVELITKVHGELTGIRYCMDGGVKKSCDEIGCPDGTTIIIRNLFYNTPARRKFLKTAATEAGYISDLMDRLALSHPDVSFKFINNNQNKLHTSGNANLKDIIYHVFGRDITGQLLTVDTSTELMKVTGYIGKPILSRGNRSWENYFINGRYIKSNIITKAIEDAYKTFVMIHKYPFTALQFEIDPQLIDVNVHPRKMEIRFNQNEAVYNETYNLVRAVLEHRELIPSARLDNKVQAPEKTEQKSIPEPFEVQRLASYGDHSKPQPQARPQPKPQPRPAGSLHESRPAYNSRSYTGTTQMNTPYATAPHATAPQTTTQPTNRVAPANSLSPTITAAPVETKSEATPAVQATSIQAAIEQKQAPEQVIEQPAIKDSQQLDLFGDRFLDQKAKLKHRLIGQVFDTYWLIEYDGKLFIIDQHAAHEKVLYEQLSHDFANHAMLKQMLAPPVILTLSMQEAEIYKKHASVFEELCFEIEAFGGKEYAIRAVPLQLFGMDAKNIFIEILDSLSEESSRIEGNAITYRIATMACKAAVKGNHTMSFEEADHLIELLLQAENPYTCPHGRPTIISISKYEMEKKFKRIQ